MEGIKKLEIMTTLMAGMDLNLWSVITHRHVFDVLAEIWINEICLFTQTTIGHGTKHLQDGSKLSTWRVV